MVRWLALAVLAIGLVGCGSGPGDEPGKTGEQQTQEDQSKSPDMQEN